MMQERKLIISVLTLFVFLKTGVMANDPLTSFPPPRVIRTHNNQGAVVFWDATAYVERFSVLGTSKERAIALIEYKAFKIFEAESRRLPSTDHHLTIIAAFAKTGALESRYQTQSFEGVQNLLTLDGNVHRRMHFGGDADTRAQLGRFPPGLRMQLASQILNEGD